MAPDMASPAAEGPPEPPAAPPAVAPSEPVKDTGIMAALMAAVEPARPVAATGAGARPAGDDPAEKVDTDGVVDRSSPGVTSAAFKAPEDLTGAGSDAAGARHKEGVFKTLIRAGATRWAKGGGAANKRLDLKKARAGAHQVKETRTTTVSKSPGIPSRNGSGGAGGGNRTSGGNSGNPRRNSTGTGSAGTGRGGSGGATGGGRGSSGSDRRGGGRGTSGNGAGGSSKDISSKGPKGAGSKEKDGPSGSGGAGGKAAKDGKGGPTGSGGGSTSGGSAGANSGKPKDTAGRGNGAKADLKKGDGGQGTGGSSGSGGGSGKSGKKRTGGAAAAGSQGTGATENRTALQRSRETGHGDGSAVRNTVDHVKAYAQGARDGYQDTKEANGKEHARLDQAHAKHKTQQPKKDDTKHQGTTVTGPSGQTLVIDPPDEGDDGVSTDVKPLRVSEIDANTLTLGTQSTRGSISRKELRNFKQYERKLTAKENHLIKVADACKSLEAAAEDEAKDCQELADQAKAVEGGEKLAAKLTKLADQAKNQVTEAAELRQRAQRAAEMCKVVLTNIGTRYAPLYKAVVDSDETKLAELRFYNDKGSYASAA